ncbi:hypothetical protein CWE04_12545 [Thomasclavelia cocleata]|uniref:Uncharacterized protein n=1 Tax=Thomasclavelia cocleata TaxID=69824 RepID=A0A1I0D9N8_9FIRM|nr:hypothetical protein [Thomasclavelia cocleata]MCR1960414.1 hypothetical protein [Thomasclavelia cocleata]NDO41952.1 hypothetical protein [Thomasclavelia cocleata]PJN80014.1 hypothetical protein CWE04_12545 [Thomasclavelia cocleata]SET29002.1 hypothetical protein SAMN04489758_10588 [Thomasclavelia cocleata]
MIKKKIGIGTISLLLVIFAFIWSFNILDFCIGDKVLEFFNIPTWSGNSHGQQIVDTFFIVTFTRDGQSIHYTVFYSFILLFPALVLAVKNKNDLFADIGKWSAIIFITLLIVSPLLII